MTLAFSSLSYPTRWPSFLSTYTCCCNPDWRFVSLKMPQRHLQVWNISFPFTRVPTFQLWIALCFSSAVQCKFFSNIHRSYWKLVFFHLAIFWTNYFLLFIIKITLTFCDNGMVFFPCWFRTLVRTGFILFSGSCCCLDCVFVCCFNTF